MTVPFVDLQSTHASIRADLAAVTSRVIDSSWFILGRELQAFEEEFAAYSGAAHCVGVGSGTDALVLALKACGIGGGDEVITPAHTFIAGPMAIASIGAVPVFVDVDERSANISVSRVEEAITSRTRAIMPVHLYGRCADVGALAELAHKQGLWLIEDAAQAHGARIDGRHAGTFGQIGCFSFYPTKNLGALGDGGAVVTDDPDLAARVRLLRNYGETRKYEHQIVGLNSRLDELQAAILRAKLPHLDAWNGARRAAAMAYGQRLDPSLFPPSPTGASDHAFHLYVIRAQRRDAVRAVLADRGVATQIHYPIPAHRQPAIHAVPHVARDLDVTDRLATEVLSLPMFPSISLAQIDRVTSELAAALAATS